MDEKGGTSTILLFENLFKNIRIEQSSINTFFLFFSLFSLVQYICIYSFQKHTHTHTHTQKLRQFGEETLKKNNKKKFA